MVLSGATRDRAGFAAPEEYVGFEVLDARYQRMGRLEELLVDAGGEPRYARVRVGWLGLRSALIPTRAVWVDGRRRILMLHQRSARDRTLDGPPSG